MQGEDAMTGCAEMRPLLGEWLAGALEEEQARALEAHVGACAACASELAALSRLEDALLSGRREAPRPPARRWRRALAVAAAACLLAWAGGTVALLREGPPRSTRILHGDVARAADVFEARTPSVLQLADASLVELASGARAAERGEGRRGVRLLEGAARFHAVSSGVGEPFAVETPLGTATALGTTFGVRVEGGAKMLEAGLARGPAVAGAVVIAVVSGVVGWKSHDGAVSAEVRAGERALAREGKVEVAKAPAEEETEARLGLALARVDALEKEKAALASDRASLARKVDATERRLASLEKAASETAAAAATAQAAAPAPSPAKRLKVGFGKWAELKEVREADWADAGGAEKNMGAYVAEIVYKSEHGEELSAETNAALQNENRRIVRSVVGVFGRLPTHAAMGNGEFTHPVMLANFVASHLEAAGLPLDDRQVAAIAALGEEYDAAWERAQAGYTDETLGVEKIVDELELKLRFMDGLRALLRPEQTAVIEIPGVRDVLMVDQHSPMLMLVAHVAPVAFPTREEIVAHIARGITTVLGGDDAARERGDALAAAWLAEAAPRLEPAPRGWHADWIPRDAAIQAGRASAKIRKEILKLLPADSQARARLLAEKSFSVPRLMPPE